ncbi:MAG: hypothetical protein ACRCZF_14555 [Gemmataceae bacterium]
MFIARNRTTPSKQPRWQFCEGVLLSILASQGPLMYGIAVGDERFYVRTGNEWMAIRTAKPNGGR